MNTFDRVTCFLEVGLSSLTYAFSMEAMWVGTKESIVSFAIEACNNFNHIPYLQELDLSHLQNVVLGIVGFLIPFGIAFQKSTVSDKESRGEFGSLVINSLLKIKTVFICSVVLLIVFALFAGKNTQSITKVVIVIASLSSIIRICSLFLKARHYSQGNRHKYEIEFLSNSKSKSEVIVKARKGVWSTEVIDRNNEQEFTDEFISQVDWLIEEAKFSNVVYYTLGYVGGINKRNNNLSVQKIWSKALERDKKFFFCESERFDQNSEYFQNDVIPTIAEYLLKRNYASYNMIMSLKSHVSQPQQDRYQTKLIDNLSKVFFENITDSPERYQIRNSWFPSERKITLGNYQASVIVKTFLNSFLRRSKDIIEHYRESSDEAHTQITKLDDVLSHLFGEEIDTISMRNFLMLRVALAINVNSPSARVDFLIGTDAGFGFMSRINRVATPASEEETTQALETAYTNQQKNTYELIRTIEGSALSSKVAELKDQLNSTDIQVLYDTEEKERRKNTYVQFIEELLSHQPQ